MPQRHQTLTQQSAHGQLAAALAEVRRAHDVATEYPADALAEAERVAERGPSDAPTRDLREIPFVTLDPVGSRDLDQAFHIERADAGWIVHYAIADVAAFVAPGGALDAETRRRGQTLYLPDGSVPLHPLVLSEGAVSLLPGVDRSAYVWRFELAADGTAVTASVERALVRSREQLDYPSAQQALDAADQTEVTGPLAMLPEVGKARIAQEQARGGASLNMPDEEIVRDETGYRIERREPLHVEEWNAQLSLLTGITAGEMMLSAGVGILRTMPAPEPAALEEFRTRVAALGHPWSTDIDYGEYLRQLDAARPETAAVLQAAVALFRGASYEVIDGTAPKNPVQAAIAAPYAHVTAPLRRLVDRWGLAVCEALCAGRPVPEWARESLSELPALMRASASRAGQIDSEVLDRVEAALMRDRVGETFAAVVVSAKPGRSRVQLADPAVTADVAAELSPGSTIRVRLVGADVSTGKVELAVATAAAPAVSD